MLDTGRIATMEAIEKVNSPRARKCDGIPHVLSEIHLGP